MSRRTSIGSPGAPTQRARIVGPSLENPAAQLDRMDGEAERQSFLGWQTVTEHLVTLRKRIEDRRPKISSYLRGMDNRVPRKGERDGRDDLLDGPPRATSVRKAEGDDMLARPAPSTIGSDQDADARAHDFVDDLLDPPYPFDVLASLYENSGPLRRNVDAMAANVDGFGYQFLPVLDFSHPDVKRHVADLMFLRNMEEAHVDASDLEEIEENLDELEPKPLEVKKARRVWERAAMVERHLLHAYFEKLHPRLSFTALRMQMRENLELFGNAGWEVLREKRDDVYSKIEQVYNIPFASIRLVRQDKVPTSVKVRVRKDAIRWEELTFRRYFRRYVRITGVSKTYYKEFGDPRVVSRLSGRYYDRVEDLRANEGADAQPANEFLHFAIQSLLSPYGIARWMGALLAVLGNRAAEEVNFLYFDNKAIPPMVVLVSGGQLSQSSVERLEKFLEERLKGRENFHKILIIEGVSQDAKETAGDLEPSGKVRVEIKPLTSDMLQDGLFQQYDAANEMKIGRAFRQPPLLTGDQRDANRSTADTVKAVAEEQVYQPARDLFDTEIDRLFLSNMNIRFWRFKTNAPVTRFPNDLVENATKAMLRGAIDPNECRALLSDAFSKTFEHRTESWAAIPPTLAAAAARQGGVQDAQATDPELLPPTPPQKPGGSGKPGEQKPQGAVLQQKGELVARGRTSEDAGHEHQFAVFREGSRARVVTSPAGEDGHVHPDEVVRWSSGGAVSETLDPRADGKDDHTHEVDFVLPESERAQKLRSFASGVLAMRRAIEEEYGEAKRDFFSQATWEREFADYSAKREAEAASPPSSAPR